MRDEEEKNYILEEMYDLETRKRQNATKCSCTAFLRNPDTFF